MESTKNYEREKKKLPSIKSNATAITAHHRRLRRYHHRRWPSQTAKAARNQILRAHTFI